MLRTGYRWKLAKGTPQTLASVEIQQQAPDASQTGEGGLGKQLTCVASEIFDPMLFPNAM